MFRWTVYVNGGHGKYFHCAVVVGHKVYCFGGNQNEVHHVFNTVSLRWMTVPPMTAGREHRLYSHLAVLIEQYVYIHGEDNFLRKYDVYVNGADMFVRQYKLHAFDVITHTWFELRTSGTFPEVWWPRGAACVLGRVMYVYGGGILGENTNDIYKLDTTTLVWSLINARGKRPPATEGHSATIIGTKMFVFGGARDQEESNIMRVFDTKTNRWLNTPSPQILPEGRRDHSAFVYNGELYILGGQGHHVFPHHRGRRRGPLQSFFDLWKFNPKNFSWKKVDPKGPSPFGFFPRQMPMCLCVVGNRIILFGGYRQPYRQFLGRIVLTDKLFMLDLRPSLKTLCKLAVVQCKLKQSGLPHNIRRELEAMTTETAPLL